MKNLMCYGNEEFRTPYHYTECGLDDVYLLSGYEVHNTSHGEGVSVKDTDNLHRVIGEYLAMHKKIMSGKEVRFLRKQMDLTQSELGKWLGVSDQQIARYEKGSEMPGAVDSLLRALYLESIGNEIALRELLSALDEFDAPLTEKQMFVEENGVWKPKIAA